MATTVVDPADQNVFAQVAEELRRSNAANAAAQEENRRILEALSRKTAALPDPAAQRVPSVEFNFSDPTGSAMALIDQRINERVAPYVNSAIAGTAQVLRTNARQIAERNPELKDVFEHFGPDIEKRMNDRVGPAGHADPQYWLDMAVLIAHEKRTELAQKRQTARDTFTETGGPGGNGPTKSATEIDPDTAAMLRKQGQDPSDSKILEFYNRALARRRGEAA